MFEPVYTKKTALDNLSDAGVSIWLDYLSREMLDSGELLQLTQQRNVVGVTTNPTIFAAALKDSQSYLKQLQVQTKNNTAEALFNITTTDVADACDVFNVIYEKSCGVDGRVSIEIDPNLANDTAATIIAAKNLYQKIGKENVMIKIPATIAGLEAIVETLAAGISVNVTLIFSLERYRAVTNAFMTGLEKAHKAGFDISKIHSVASFFVSRLDSEVDSRLDKLNTAAALSLRGKAALANCRLAYQIYEQQFACLRWEVLEAAGAYKQRLLWASTAVKDPNYLDTTYVTQLVANNTVNTMPKLTLEACYDHANIVGDTICDSYEDSKQVLNDLFALGIDYNEVVELLEVEGINKFVVSWDDLTNIVASSLKNIES